MSIVEGCKILVVEDEPFMRTTIKAVLRGVDRFDVREADDGDVALELIAEFAPDMVLCDIGMPRMGGLEFVARLRNHPDRRIHDTPVVILTGHADEATVRDAVRLRISGFLIKPVSPKALRAHLQTILSRRGRIPAA